VGPGQSAAADEGDGVVALAPRRPNKLSQCVNQAVEAYFLTLTVPKDDFSCPAMEQPATPAPMTRAAGPYLS
jgi:hypothetical protein